MALRCPWRRSAYCPPHDSSMLHAPRDHSEPCNMRAMSACWRLGARLYLNTSELRLCVTVLQSTHHTHATSCAWADTNTCCTADVLGTCSHIKMHHHNGSPRTTVCNHPMQGSSTAKPQDDTSCHPCIAAEVCTSSDECAQQGSPCPHSPRHPYSSSHIHHYATRVQPMHHHARTLHKAPTAALPPPMHGASGIEMLWD